ncbi:LysR family substrate-binding domain-containing protein [Microbacterium sp.]|uniref:LysR family substrate-binding domain-containing protein n=1 Tax=Microbacterium sp. TaxID=51671 RepID=UPI002D7A150E|nr:LysR family substrate-binding domain-containing protein [Microbacterium sp.]HET6303013.1 LysR family substrate-binding domain-containing protein [Microbacterium sp.]
MSERYRPGYAGDMAKGGGSGARGRGSGRGRRPPAARSGAKGKPSVKAPRRNRPRTAPEAAEEPIRPARFTLGAIAGATPGKWIATWRERVPEVPLELRHISVATQRDELLAPRDPDAEEPPLDAALVRLPMDREGLHVLPLYDEVPVVVVSKESHLTAADVLELDDLAGEVVIVPRDDVLRVEVPGAAAASFDPPDDTEQAIATVAAGVGIVIVPMSLARLHHRRDVEHRPLRDGPTSTVALAWPADRTTPLVDTFVGIVRGRTANSSR